MVVSSFLLADSLFPSPRSRVSRGLDREVRSAPVRACSFVLNSLCLVRGKVSHDQMSRWSFRPASAHERAPNDGMNRTGVLAI